MWCPRVPAPHRYWLWISARTCHHSKRLYACVRVCVCVRACVLVCEMWWRAVLSRARAECHWAHSDSLQHRCNHDAPPANERAEGGRTGLLWLSWQGERGRWCRASLFRGCWRSVFGSQVDGCSPCGCSRVHMCVQEWFGRPWQDELFNKKQTDIEQ